MREGVVRQEPDPRRALVIGGVACARVACVSPAIPRITRGKAAQPVRCEQPPAARLEHGAATRGGQRRFCERDREDLVGAHSCVRPVRAVDHVVEAARLLVPEALERARHARRHLVVRLVRPLEPPREAPHGAQRVVPERVHIDRLALARRDRRAVHARVHPRQRDSRLTRVQQPVARIHADPVARAALVPRADVLERRVELGQESVVVRGLDVRPHRLEHPQRCVHRAVLGGISALEEAIGQHATVHVARVRREHGPRHLGSARREGQARERDHRVAPPVAEPRIARDHRAPGGIGIAPALGDEPVGREHELPHPVRRNSRERAVRLRPRRVQAPVVRPAPRQRARQRQRPAPGKPGVVPRGREHGERIPRLDARADLGHAHVILDGFQPALGLERQREPAIPVVRSAHLRAGSEQPQGRCARERHDLEPAHRLFDAGVPGAARRERVRVAMVRERLQHQPHRGRRRCQPVLHVGRVLAVLHPHALLEAHVAQRPGPHRDRALQPERLEMHGLAGGDRAARPAVHVQLDPATVVPESLRELGEQQGAAERGIEGGDQQAVVAARQRAGYGAARVAADSVRHQPLEAVAVAGPREPVPAESQAAHRNLLVSVKHFREGSYSRSGGEARFLVSGGDGGGTVLDGMDAGNPERAGNHSACLAK